MSPRDKSIIDADADADVDTANCKIEHHCTTDYAVCEQRNYVTLVFLSLPPFGPCCCLRTDNLRCADNNAGRKVNEYHRSPLKVGRAKKCVGLVCNRQPGAEYCGGDGGGGRAPYSSAPCFSVRSVLNGSNWRSFLRILVKEIGANASINLIIFLLGRVGAPLGRNPHFSMRSKNLTI